MLFGFAVPNFLSCKWRKNNTAFRIAVRAVTYSPPVFCCWLECTFFKGAQKWPMSYLSLRFVAGLRWFYLYTFSNSLFSFEPWGSAEISCLLVVTAFLLEIGSDWTEIDLNHCFCCDFCYNSYNNTLFCLQIYFKKFLENTNLTCAHRNGLESSIQTTFVIAPASNVPF